ncbi:uncharacterized protein LOC115664014 [Syzygium oleosum]|uniref:uncharacterized protein LOC115664014 n=1 Tax=Syzygium oleosum TaxID=219896 RepID=UPI0024BB2C20|nr:uncharacterized protein LOC115664014 [Syzygium oleosum]
MRDLQGSRTGTVNETITEATVVVKRLQTPEGKLAQIELSVGVVAFLLLLLVAFGSLRRRNNSPMLKVVLWAAFTLSGYLITYTLGLMHESPFRNPLFPLWATFLMIFLGSSNSFSAYSLEDNEQWKQYAWQHIVTFIGFVTLWAFYLTILPLTLAVFVLYFVLLMLKTTERALSLVSLHAGGRHRITKWVVDHVSAEDCSPVPDDNPMEGCKYVVKASRTVLLKVLSEGAAPSPNSSKDDGEVITVGKVWACKGPLLNSKKGKHTGDKLEEHPGDKPGNKLEEGDRLKDICLSYALYLLLRLKFSRYLLPEKAHRKAWVFIRDGILRQKSGYERAFRVAEVELTFLHDYFYTNYPIIFQARLWPLKVVELLCLIIGTMLTVVFLMPKTTKPQDAVVQLVTSHGLSVDVLMTALVLMVFICVEVVQLYLMAISEWAKVRWLSNYVEKKSWHGNKLMEKLIGLICRVHLKPWERKLRQYSFLESYNYVPSRFLHNFFTTYFIDVVRSGQKQGTPVDLSDEVKKAVFDSLVKGDEKLVKLKNGQASLTANGVSNKLSWACELKTQTEVIMVWHIATSILEHKPPLKEDSNFRVATQLSKYLAYLVAFEPRLLPDHPFDAENEFNQTIHEARKVLEGYKTDEARIKRLKKIAETSGDTVMKRGARLGNQLLEEDLQRIWEILAEFWAELTLYVAPSDDAKAHAQRLAMGGEFVTHLWALVSHAGIEREPPSQPQTLTPSQSSTI